MPAAEVDISPDLVRRLLAAQQPDLAHLPVTVMAHGWDNVMCRIGDDLVARLPRRALAVKFLLHEQRWLPVLAPRLPLPVPALVRAGRPGLGYPWPWSIVPFLPGQPAAGNPPADPGTAAASLGGFLGALHTPAAPHTPVHNSRGIPLADRSAVFAQNLDALGNRIDRGAVVRLWKVALAAPVWAGPPLWLHGDLHPANILVHRGRISGVIDFGDVTGGDPAGDLSIAWMLLPVEHHETFQNAYRSSAGHPADDACWTRAKGWALAMSLVYLAHSADNAQLAGMGQRTLSAVLA